MKTCSKCKSAKPASEFFKSGRYPSGKPKVRGDCKACASKDTSEWRRKNRAVYNSYMADYRTKNPDAFRAIDMKRNYGLSIDDYREMLRQQNGVCKICEKPPSGKRPLAIDHCHRTKKVRGILCYGCNRSITFLDGHNLLSKALAYLRDNS